MKTEKLTLVSVGLILTVAVLLSFNVARSVKLVQPSAMPVFYEEETKAIRADKVINVIQGVKVGQVTMVNEAIKSPVTSATPLPIFPPQITFKVLPVYPATALQQGLSGKTILSVLIGAAGQAEQVKVKTSSGIADLDQAAVNAVSQWKFNPALQGAAVMASCLEIPVRFNIINN